jgi:hypothetical protein
VRDENISAVVCIDERRRDVISRRIAGSVVSNSITSTTCSFVTSHHG